MKKIALMALMALMLVIMTSTTTRRTRELNSTWYSVEYFKGKRTADGTVVRNSSQRIVALSPDMFNKGFKMGDKIHVVSKHDLIINGVWTVRDKTGGGRTNHIDFLLNKREGRGFHNGKVTVTKI